ncbi:MAG: hypothetical protein V4857_02435 [Pseudomonadota bacterium]
MLEFKRYTACVRDFLRSNKDEQIVTLRASDRGGSADCERPTQLRTVRLVRHVASTGKVRALMTGLRALMTGLLDEAEFPIVEFGDRYHQ